MSIKTVVALMALLIPSVASAGVLDVAEPRRYIIEDDFGGDVAEFEKALYFMSKEKMKVKLVGVCGSSCTLILSDKYDIDVCIDKTIMLGVHKPYPRNQFGLVVRTITEVVGSEKVWREKFFSKYPTWLQTAILARGGVPSVIQGDSPGKGLMFVYDDLKPFMKVCDD